ncbi:ISP domain-containing protein [Corynespora cassiicola Philippines]|uniref:Choline monooxygenase, chloroplastic n=1 Tax=Corynespora cassiicola Philippines TaxID=1448308 RepID=A0A2T2N8B9_CORCC|nr:ISP domain-containing protein [Corynespora cassiicola Philippines]
MTSLLSSFGFGRQQTKEEEPKAVRALPASWYTSQEMYELERRAIFSRKWLLMTHQSRFKEPGDFVRYNSAGFDFIMTKDRTGKINAFHNVCRHRAYPVVEAEEGKAKILACKYHGWSYGLNGKLAKAPGYQDLKSFDKEQNGLIPIHVHVDRNGFVFVNLDSKETPELSWEAELGGSDEQERLKQFNYDDYELDHTYEMVGEFNWKILADNFNECYHCKTTHPDVPDLANLESYDVYPKVSWIQHDAATTEEQKQKGLYINSTYFFPNVSATVTPHFMMIQKFSPFAPGKSAMRYEIFRNKHSSDEDFKLISTMYARIMAEDKVLCDLAQRNLNTGVFIAGEMHPKMEKGPLFFQKTCREVVVEFHKREKAAGQEIWPARQELPSSAKVSQDDIDFCSGLTCSTTNQNQALVW